MVRDVSAMLVEMMNLLLVEEVKMSLCYYIGREEYRGRI